MSHLLKFIARWLFWNALVMVAVVYDIKLAAALLLPVHSYAYLGVCAWLMLLAFVFQRDWRFVRRQEEAARWERLLNEEE